MYMCLIQQILSYVRLEQKLNKRRAKLEDLKRKGEDAKMLNKHVKDKGKEKEQQQLVTIN